MWSSEPNAWYGNRRSPERGPADSAGPPDNPDNPVTVPVTARYRGFGPFSLLKPGRWRGPIPRYPFFKKSVRPGTQQKKFSIVVS